MKTPVIVGAVVLFVIVAFFGHNWNKGARFEANIKGFHIKAQSTLSTLVNDMESQGLITKEQREFTLDVIQQANAKYGETGLKSVFTALHEANYPISESRFNQWAQLASARWSEFHAAQTAQVDEVQRYQAWLDSWNSMCFGRYPRIKLEDFRQIVMADKAADAYQSKRINAKDLFPK